MHDDPRLAAARRDADAEARKRSAKVIDQLTWRSGMPLIETDGLLGDEGTTVRQCGQFEKPRSRRWPGCLHCGAPTCSLIVRPNLHSAFALRSCGMPRDVKPCTTSEGRRNS